MANLLDRIFAYKNDLSKSERKVASAILSQPKLAVQETIAQLAKRANVSEPTVCRFCKHFDAKGFPEFKVALSNDLNQERHQVVDNIKIGDSVEDIVVKVIDSNISALNDLSRNIDSSVLARCLDIVSQARRIVILSQGLSNTIAYDLHSRLAILGIASEIYHDPCAMLLATTSLRQGELAIAISATGYNKDVIEATLNAKLSGSSVIELCPLDSPLSKECILTLKTPIVDDHQQDNLMVFRMVMQTIMHIVICGVMLRRSDTIHELKDRLFSARQRSLLNQEEKSKDISKSNDLKPNTPITSINWP